LPEPAQPVRYDGLPSATVGVADEVLARAPALSRTRLLAVDGPAGSGKTTLAHGIAAVIADRGYRVGVLSLDDLYDGWTGLNPALESRVLEQVLEPLGSGHLARWQAYDWQSRAFAEWHDLAPGDVLVLEGCGSGARRFAPYTTLLVWVEAAPAVRARRAVARDGEQVLRHWADWAAAEERTFAANETRSRAQLSVWT